MTKLTRDKLGVGLACATVVLALILFCTLVTCIGCMGTDGVGMRWAPSEQQKQAADLVVQDVKALKPHVPAVAEPIRAEAERAAKTTRAYVGRPQEPLEPVDVSGAPVHDPVKEKALTDAQQAADRPPPTIGDVGYDLATVVLTSLGSMGGIGGLALGVRKMLRNRRKHQQMEKDLLYAKHSLRGSREEINDFAIEADEQASAVDELVGQIEKIKTYAAGVGFAETVKGVLDKQSFETQKIVSKARLNAG